MLQSVIVFFRASCLMAWTMMNPDSIPSHLCLNAVFEVWWWRATSRVTRHTDAVRRRICKLMMLLLAFPVVQMLGTGELFYTQPMHHFLL